MFRRFWDMIISSVFVGGYAVSIPNSALDIIHNNKHFPLEEFLLENKRPYRSSMDYVVLSQYAKDILGKVRYYVDCHNGPQGSRDGNIDTIYFRDREDAAKFMIAFEGSKPRY